MTILRKNDLHDQTRPFSNHLDNTSCILDAGRCHTGEIILIRPPYIRAILIDMSMWQVANGYSPRCNAPILSFFPFSLLNLRRFNQISINTRSMEKIKRSRFNNSITSFRINYYFSLNTIFVPNENKDWNFSPSRKKCYLYTLKTS